jgi:prepilin-type N-terminal cleavage/methylation domain-containing protein
MTIVKRPLQAGFSLVELMIASSLLGLMVLAVTTLAQSGTEAQEYARRLTRATEITQDIVDRMRLEMVSCVRIFGNDAEGNANLAVLDLSGAPAPIGSRRLPTVSVNETIRKDTAGAQITGNSLFFTKLAWSDRFVCTSGNDYMVDVYRWIHYYLTPEDGGPQPEHPIGLNIIRVVSEPLIDAAGIDRITDLDDRAEVLLHLWNATPDANGATHAPCEVVWLRGSLPATVGTLRHIDSSDGSLSDTPLSPRTTPWRVLRATQEVDSLLSYRHHSVASNFSRSSFGVGRFSLMDLTGSGFPHGFEVQVVGPSAARQVLLHLVVSSTSRRGQFAWSDVQITVDARDL